MTTPNRPTPASVRCGLYKLGAEGPTPAGVVLPGDELFLWLEVPAGHWHRDLVVEFWRGDRLRDRWQRRLTGADHITQALRLRWGEGKGSSRLTCRVLIDGREVARRTALLGPGVADAQGRLPENAATDASPPTLLAFVEELGRQLGEADRAR